MAGVIEISEPSLRLMNAAVGGRNVPADAPDGISEAYQIQLQYTSSILYVKRLSPDTVLPQIQSGYDAGYYIYNPKDVIIPARGYVVVDTQLAITFPRGTYGRIASIRVWAVTYGFYVAPYSYGPGYDGSIVVTIFNHTDNTYNLKAGYIVAVLVIDAISEPQIVEI